MNNEKIVIEVGANDGRDTKQYYNQFKLPMYCFEPVPKNFINLKEKFKNYPFIHFFDYAIDVEKGVRNFYISGEAHSHGCSSLHEFTENIHELWPNRQDFIVTEVVKVNTIRLDEFIRTNNLTESSIEYLHCDAQGNDVNVLMSLGEYINNVRAGKIEVASKVELYKNTNNTFENACRFLMRAGFKLGTDKNRLRLQETDIHFWRD